MVSKYFINFTDDFTDKSISSTLKLLSFESIDSFNWMSIKAYVRFTTELRDFMPCACKQTLGLEDLKTKTLRAELLFQIA